MRSIRRARELRWLWCLWRSSPRTVTSPRPGRSSPDTDTRTSSDGNPPLSAIRKGGASLIRSRVCCGRFRNDGQVRVNRICFAAPCSITLCAPSAASATKRRNFPSKGCIFIIFFNFAAIRGADLGPELFRMS